jgi:hypothetical protein
MDWPHRFDRAMTELALANRENAKLRSALREARDCIETWGAQADAYLQEKHDLAGDLAAIDAILGPEYACPKCGKLAPTLWGDCEHNDGSIAQEQGGDG